jgi:hypothetical protein
VPPLVENPTLDLAANKKAQDMLAKQYFAHDGPDNRQVGDWLNDAGYRYITAGENLAMGFAAPEEVVDGWTKSQTHYANMIDSDFNEIGVSLVVGKYDNVETTLVAQYFGRPSGEKVMIIQPLTASKVASSTLAAGTSGAKVLGVKKYNTDILVDQSRSVMTFSDDPTTGGRQVKAVVYAGRDVAAATVSFGGYTFSLKQDQNDKSLWTGELLIFKDNIDKAFMPLVLPNLRVSDALGNTLDTDLVWAKTPAQRPSLFREYSLMKQYKSLDLSNLFLVSSLYYKALLLLALVALAFNTFIEIKRQYPRMIFSAIGFIILLVILIIV